MFPLKFHSGFVTLKPMRIFRSYWIAILILLLFIIPAVLPLFTSYVPGTADGLAHKFRLVDFEQSIAEGHLRPRWLSAQALGYGAPVNLFIYLFPYYFIAFFNTAGYSINVSTQIFEAATILLSGLFMFLLVRKLWDTKAALAAGVVYAWAPYHLLSIYLYEGWGEMGAFVFLPLLLYLILMLWDVLNQHSQKVQISNFKFQIIFLALVISWALFVLTHNVSAYMMSPVILILGFIAFDFKIKPFLVIINAFVMTMFISAFFWMPAIMMNKFTAYPALIAREIWMRGSYFKSLATLTQFAWQSITSGVTHYYDFTIGIPLFISGVASFFILIALLVKKHKKKMQPDNLHFLIAVLTVFFLSLYTANHASDWIWNIPLLHYIVYPFRFLLPVTFTGSILAGYLSRKNTAVTVLFAIMAVIAGWPYTNPWVDHFPFDDAYFKSNQTIFMAPKTMKNMATKEFVPVWVKEDYLHELESKYWTSGKLSDKFSVPDNAGTIITTKVTNESFSGKADMKTDALVTANTFYFPNWEAKIDGTPATVAKDINGLLVLQVPKGQHQLDFNFSVSQTENTGNFISVAGIIILLFELAFFQKILPKFLKG